MATHNLSIGYPNNVVACAIDEALLAGEIVCLIGPNGAGKSTLIRTLAGMQPPLEGQVRLLGDEVQSLESRELAQRLSVVLTERVNVGLLSGYALVALGRHPYTDWTGQLSARDDAVVRWAVEAVGAEAIAPRPVNELSDGERQKLMIARALAQEPAVMVLDEPTAYLDLPRRVEIMLLLRDLARNTGRAILLSTHDLDLALRNADRIWLMPGGEALQVGAPEDLVLSGSFERAFASEGVQFDTRSGSFQATVEHTRTVALEGDGVGAVWTRRGLERAGYRVADEGAVTIRMEDGHWILLDSSGQRKFATVYDLIQALS